MANYEEGASEAEELGRALIKVCKVHLFDESVPRIIKCLSILSEDEIWHRPNEETVSIGNLVLHLCGNVGQYIVSGLGDAPDDRERDAEFAHPGPLPTSELVTRLEETMRAAEQVIDALDPTSFLSQVRVQGREQTVIEALVHVVEHFSYHTGQITYSVKARKAVDLGYYAGQDLDITDKK